MLDWTQIELAWVSGKHCVFRAVESDDEVIGTDVAFLGGTNEDPRHHTTRLPLIPRTFVKESPPILSFCTWPRFRWW